MTVHLRRRRQHEIAVRLAAPPPRRCGPDRPLPATGRIHWSTAAVSGLALTALLLSGCAGARSDDGADPSAGKRAAAGAEVESPAPARRLILTGELRAVHSDDIIVPRSDVWPIQIRWMEEEGTEVRAGQEVVQIDNTAVSSNLEEQRLAHFEAGIRLRSRENELKAERAEKTFALERARVELRKAELQAAVPAEFLARRDWEDKQVAAERSRAAQEKAERDLEAFETAAAADLDVLRIDLSKAERQIERTERTLKDLTLRAPRDGVLVHGDHPWQGRKFEPGDNVWPGLTIMRIPDLSQVEVLAWLSDADDGGVAIGRRATCRLDTYPERAFVGRVTEVGTLAEERGRGTGVRAFRVVVALEESDPAVMRPGMSVKVEFLDEEG